MALYRRGPVWWIDFTTPDGRRVRRSTGTEDKVAATEYHDRLKSERWRQENLGQREKWSWQQAVVRWLRDKQHKASIEGDRMHLRWLDKHLGGLMLHQIDSDLLERVISQRLSEGVSHATVNRMLEVLRAILRRAERNWRCLDRAPVVPMLPEPRRRVRWLKPAEAARLVEELPEHLAEMARFSLATGLRKSNVTELEWSQVDLDGCRAWIHGDQAKAGRAIPVPLNEEAVEVLRRQRGRHPSRVFTFRGRPIRQANTRAWKNALRRAGISDFRWHDLRHTWASWHVQNGTPLNVLQELGAWETAEMVRRYAHLGAEHLALYAGRVSVSGAARENPHHVTISAQSEEDRTSSEPATHAA